MAKVRSNAAVAPEPPATAPSSSISQAAAVLTVWRKSLLFNCDGFTVFNASGDLAFRVDDCYDAAPRRRAEVVLIDATGRPLLTVRRHRTRLWLPRGLLPLPVAERCSWVIYDGDGGAASRPLLTVRRHHAGKSSSSNKAAVLAHVTTHAAAVGTEGAAYVVEGSYGRRGRACAVRDAARGGDGGDVVAEVRRKEDVGDDVFRLVAGPRLGAPLAMGLVVALDEMFVAAAAAGRSAAWPSSLRRAWSA